MTGIQWLLEEEDDWRNAVVWARGITAPERAAWIGGVPHPSPTGKRSPSCGTKRATTMR
ncbi:hypothetical protein RKD33_007804 [Streptomyces sp. SAI-129]